MKYRAVCPCCAHRLPRSGYFGPNHQCPACGAAIRPEPTWNQTGNAIAGVLLTVALIVGGAYGAIYGAAGWIVCGALFLAVTSLGWVLYPYFTPYEAVGPVSAPAPSPEPHEPTPDTRRTPTRSWVIAPNPRHGPMTAFGLALCFLAVLLWAGTFKCRRSQSCSPALHPTPGPIEAEMPISSPPPAPQSPAPQPDR